MNKTLLNVLEPVLQSETSPYKTQARFDAALIKGEIEGSYASAIADLEAITQNQNTEQALVEKASKLKQYYTDKSASQKDSSPAQGE